MDIRQITPRFFAAPQISPEDMPAILQAGVTRILCNRPDIEVPPSHQVAQMKQAAEDAGLEFVVCPLSHQNMTPDVISQNHTLMQDCDGVVLAYCASGTRSTIAWALASCTEMPVEEVLAAARRGGYELSNLLPALEEAARR
ncbi:MAG: TIGR01244 family sulfur transferase [Roseobacter sp.]